MRIFINPGVEQANELLRQANVLFTKTWLEEILFSWPWWLLTAITIIPWAAWWIWRKKECTHRLLLGGGFVMLAAYYMDVIGMALGLWSYPTTIAPLVPPFFTWDLAVIPVVTMFVLQYKPTVNPVLKSFVLAMVGAFLVQPAAVWLGFYRLKNWQHSYSFPLVIIIYLVAYYLFNGLQWKHKCENNP